MRWMVVLALSGLLAGGAAVADETQAPAPASLPLKLPAHAQPGERQIDQLPAADRSKLGVDTSSRDQKEVDQLYRQLTHEPLSGSSAPPAH